MTSLKQTVSNDGIEEKRCGKCGSVNIKRVFQSAEAHPDKTFVNEVWLCGDCGEHNSHRYKARLVR